MEEKKFIGPINLQIESVLDYLDNFTNVQLLKVPGKAKVDRNMAYPYEALEESVVNAAYHRSYENSKTTWQLRQNSGVSVIRYSLPSPSRSEIHLLISEQPKSANQ